MSAPTARAWLLAALSINLGLTAPSLWLTGIWGAVAGAWLVIAIGETIETRRTRQRYDDALERLDNLRRFIENNPAGIHFDEEDIGA